MKRRVDEAIGLVETSCDRRGWVSNLLDFLPLPVRQLKNIHLVEMKPGSVRGNHRHASQREWIVICGGPCRIVLEADGESREEHISGEQPIMLTLSPGITHAIKYNGDATAVLVCLSDKPYNFEHPDVESVTLIE